jgi:hypothetical protein
MASAARKTSYISSSDSSSGSESSPGWNKVENNKKKNNSFATTGGNNGGRGQQAQGRVASNHPPRSALLPNKDIKDSDPLSICIPRAFKNTSSQRVFETFRRLNFGFIDGVDVVPKTAENGEDYVRIFVHFTRWNHSNPDAKKFREQIVKGEQVNILYDQPKPWFWKCSLSRLTRLLPREPAAEAAPEAAPLVPAPVPCSAPMFPPLPRFGTAEYMNLFSIVDTINTKK